EKVLPAHGNGCQTGGETLAVIEFLKECDGSPEIICELVRIAYLFTRHAQQVKRLRQPLAVLQFLKNGECLLVKGERLMRLFDVDVPIAHAIQRVRQRVRIAQRAGERQGLLK